MTRQQRRNEERKAKKESRARYPKSISMREYCWKCVTPEGSHWAYKKYMTFYGLNNKYLGNGALRGEV